MDLSTIIAFKVGIISLENRSLSQTSSRGYMFLPNSVIKHNGNMIFITFMKSLLIWNPESDSGKPKVEDDLPCLLNDIM